MKDAYTCTCGQLVFYAIPHACGREAGNGDARTGRDAHPPRPAPAHLSPPDPFCDGLLALDCDCPWEEHGIGLQTIRTTFHTLSCTKTILAPGGARTPADSLPTSGGRTEGALTPEAGAKPSAAARETNE